MPLHLFFNSVFFTPSQSNRYAVTVVGLDFFQVSWTPTSENSSPSLFGNDGHYANQTEFERRDNSSVVTLLKGTHRNARGTNYTTLDSSECITAYSQGFVQSYSDVLIFADGTSGFPLLWSRFPERSISSDRKHINQDAFEWICHDHLNKVNATEDRCSAGITNDIKKAGNWTVYGHPVQSCLARRAPDTCSLQFNAWMMLAVVVIAAIKTMIILYLSIKRTNTQFLHTLGDAISSFLEREECPSSILSKCLATAGRWTTRRKSSLGEDFDGTVRTSDNSGSPSIYPPSTSSPSASL